VTVDEPRADKQPGATAAPPAALVKEAASDAALQRYGRRMRRGRIIYLAMIAVVLLGLGVTVAVVWSKGEVAHTTLTTVSSPPPSVGLGAPSAFLQKAWQSPDRTAIGVPYWGGTVITYSTDSVRGRNALTGALTWSYTRTDRTVCQAIQNQGVTIAVFEHKGNCDEVTALDSGTGERRWTRTLDKAEGQNSLPVNGHPSIRVSQFAIILTTPDVIYAINPVDGGDRWLYHPDGCTIHGAVIGTEGALISQTCTTQKCDARKFCGPGPQLLLRDGNAGRKDDDKTNPDQIKWNLMGTTAVPVSADKVTSAIDPALGQLRVLQVAKGKTISRLVLRGGLASGEPVAAVGTDHAELVWIAGTTYAVDPRGLSLLWTAATTVAPTVTPASAAQDATPALLDSTVAAATAAGIVTLDPTTGETAHTFPVPAPPAGGRIYPFGTGFVVAAAPSTVYK